MTVHCRACGLGRVDYDSPEHVHHGTSQGDGTSTIGCSGNLIQVDEVVRAWAGTGQATVVAIEEVA